ncbi:MAG TPA: Holliday junction branch migration protein RuvA [Kofleriaceae bacterium]|jgi:Holliday junction DNA helicase RuvA
MIGYLQGRILRSTPERVLVDVGGVGYDVHVPLSTYYEIERAGAHGEVRLYVHTHVRDDGILLYGFWSEREQQLFEKLLSVNGIGPRGAQVVLSGMAPDDLVQALASGDVARLVTIPGVGRKTAERMVLELRDKMRDLGPSAGPLAPPPPASDDLLDALVHLGYKPAAAERAAAEVRKEQPQAAFHELLRLSLKRLSRV